MDNHQPFGEAVLIVTREGMGSAEPELQKKLLDTYLRLLVEGARLPAAICFYTDGVKLVAEGSPLLERLRDIESRGVRLVVCSTCLSYFGLQEKVQVGIVGGMPDIIEMQARAQKVITL